MRDHPVLAERKAQAEALAKQWAEAMEDAQGAARELAAQVHAFQEEREVAAQAVALRAAGSAAMALAVAALRVAESMQEAARMARC